MKKRLLKICNKESTQGSTLLLVVLILAVAAGILAPVIRLSSTEAKLTDRHTTRIQTINAAESLVQYGLSQIVDQWKNTTNINDKDLANNNNPLIIPSHFNDLFTNQSIDTAQAQLQGGQLGDSVQIYIDPSDPSNQFDPQKGQYVNARIVSVISKATGITSMDKSNIDVYAKGSLMVRDSSLSNYAIYFSSDAEFHPTRDMDIFGPVYTEGNLWADSNANLRFHNLVSAFGQYRHGKMPGNPDPMNDGSVWFINSSGTLVFDYKGSGDPLLSSSYYDSLYSNWNQQSILLWNGNLLTDTHGVQKLNLFGFEEYNRDNPATAALDDALNNAYALIEPNMSSSDANYKGAVVEKKKYAYQAGLIIRLNEGTATGTGQYAVYDGYYLTIHKLQREDPNVPQSDASTDAQGNVTEIDVQLNPDLVNKIFKMNASYTKLALSGKKDTLNPKDLKQAGLYDPRRDDQLQTLEFNIDQFRQAVDDTKTGYDANQWTGYNPAKDYNGIVYVEFPQDSTAVPREDQITKSVDGFGLIITNASSVPDPEYNQTSNPNLGFTLATNNTMYVSGNFNADGDPNTGSAQAPDDENHLVPPASLVADAVTILSPAWNQTPDKNANVSSHKALFTEVEATIISGLVPTGDGGSSTYGGGVENHTRFIEDWKAGTLRLRGSLIGVYESEIANQPLNNDAFPPPIIEIGVSPQSANGNFPPGTPKIRSFRSVDFTTISSDTFDNELTSMNDALGN